MHLQKLTTASVRGSVALLVCALGAATAGHAAEPKKKTEEQQIQALQQQLQAVQAQLKQLVEQNQALAQHQQQLEQQVAQQQLALDKALPGATGPAQASAAQGRGAAAPGQQGQAAANASALPGTPASVTGQAAANASALPGSPASAPSSANASALPGGAANASALPGASASAGQASALPGQENTTPMAATATSGVSAANSSLPGAQSTGFGSRALDNLRLWGYGEIYYSRPSRDTSRTTADLARAVFGIGYRFDDRTEFNSEYEIEHAVTSSEDAGEFEVEQFFVDRQLFDRATLRAGLFLLPFGFINEHHEPTNFYGVTRNFVETLIIPSTWREGGLSLHGDTDYGLAWSGGVTTGVNLSGWDFFPEFPHFTTALEMQNNGAGPLAASHQELALASARHLSQYVALNYFGVPGLNVGAAVFTGKAEQAPGTAGDSRVTLWEGHARWTPGKFDLSALYAHGAISNVADANLANPGSPNPIPSAFYGYYLQAAYGAWEYGDYRLNPFVRWEYYDMGSKYSGTEPMIPTGNVALTDSPGDFGLWPQNRDRVWTAGVNFYVTPHVVFKADYQWFNLNKAFNRFDLGLGLNF